MPHSFALRAKIAMVSKGKTWLLIGLTALTLSACGIRGNLETPPPVWGDTVKAEEMTSDETKASQKDESILDESPISKKDDEGDIFGDDYLENEEPF